MIINWQSNEIFESIILYFYEILKIGSVAAVHGHQVNHILVYPLYNKKKKNIAKSLQSHGYLC